MKRLTKAEEEIMLVLWELKEATVREVILRLDDPETPYTTVSTVVRILEKKGFVEHRAVGTTHLYYPSVTKKEYLNSFLTGVVEKYFNGSFSSLASFFARERNISLEEIKDILEEVESDLNKNSR